MNSIYSVGQVNNYIRTMFDQDFMLNKIYIKGEVSNCKYHTSGHIYFSLKDESGTISCVMFAGQRKGLGFAMKTGIRWWPAAASAFTKETVSTSSMPEKSPWRAPDFCTSGFWQ